VQIGLRRPFKPGGGADAPALPPSACLALVVGAFSVDPRMTRDQWVLILVYALAATLFDAILLCHPS
jgi:hypothetical protein